MKVSKKCKQCERIENCLRAKPKICPKTIDKTPIWGKEGYVDGNGKICHKTVIVGYKEDERR